MNKPGLFFVGIAIKLKNAGDYQTALFFYKLACYVEPYNPRVWDEYINQLRNLGRMKQAFIIIKTAFLFRPFSNYAIDYLQAGDKCGIAMHELRGLYKSLKNPS